MDEGKKKEWKYDIRLSNNDNKKYVKVLRLLLVTTKRTFFLLLMVPISRDLKITLPIAKKTNKQTSKQPNTNPKMITPRTHTNNDKRYFLNNTYKWNKIIIQLQIIKKNEKKKSENTFLNYEKPVFQKPLQYDSPSQNDSFKENSIRHHIFLNTYIFKTSFKTSNSSSNIFFMAFSE